jgi:hypothetical protein
MNQDRIEQYIAGKLGPAEAEAFEAYCVANPEFAKQVEFEQRLRDGMAEVARGSTAEFVRDDSSSFHRFAIAATILLALGAVFIGWGSWTPATKPYLAAAGDAHGNVSTLRLAQVRGTVDTAALREDTTLLEIIGLFDTQYDYSVELARLTSENHTENIATLYGQRPSSTVTLEVLLNAERLRPGTYQLRVRRQTVDEEPLEIEFVKN